ncbi:hypothetical protein [Mycoplasmopsis cynos]|uniref:hypothetical protein n=1 Tax=Mycoplasmopsis cynos TaxID=171284 RepID=UPI002541DB09|nr:hypothetical protein [Mycoplasmopsis cynos]MCU9935492.1 hypothetical protein [Mycoplasmopsis cynos]
MAAALRSNGMNYNGLFGEYNLPQYDVIYGTGKDQQNSYRDEMKKKSKKKPDYLKMDLNLKMYQKNINLKIKLLNIFKISQHIVVFLD